MFSKMNNIYGLLMVLSINFVFSQKTPTITNITQNTVGDIGGTVELTCIVQYATKYPVKWLLINKEQVTNISLISINSAMIIKNLRFSLKLENDNTSYTLQIKDIQETDAGLYQCQVALGLNNRISADVELKVRSPPIISGNSTRSLIANEGQLVKLECYASGFPQPTISWRRENNFTLPSGGSIYRGNILNISNITKEDRGRYYCVAENGFGRGARHNIALDVIFAPLLDVYEPRYGQALQYDANLQCRIEAYFPAAIVWLKNGVQLSNNLHYKISNFGTSDYFTFSTLRVITIEKHQYGDYICKATNVLGTAEGVINLYETTVPAVCPPACGT